MSDSPKDQNQPLPRWNPADPRLKPGYRASLPRMAENGGPSETASKVGIASENKVVSGGSLQNDNDAELHERFKMEEKSGGGFQEKDSTRSVAVSGWKFGISRAQLQSSKNIVCPPPRLSPSEWSDQFAYLPAEQNAQPGKFRLSRRPHEAAMLDAPIDPNVREIFWMGASQTMGKTICFILLIMYVIHQMRKSIVMVRPDIDACQSWMKNKALPTIEATPCMAGLLKSPRAINSGSTALNRKYPGGSLAMIGANSPSGFRSSSAAVVLQDEIDAFQDNVEGDPCALGDRAAINFSDAWLIKASTTTLENFSRIHAGAMTGDQQQYFVPCLHCGEFQWLKTEQMKFSFLPEEHARFEEEKDQGGDASPPYRKRTFRETVNGHTWEIGKFPITDTAKTIYVCEHCRRGWTDEQRMDAYFSGHRDNPAVIVNGMELRAEWRATAPFNGIRSYLMNGMYGVIGLKKKYSTYLHQFAEEFLKAKRKGRATLMTWTNLFKNEAFSEPSEKLDWQPLKERAEDLGMKLPAQAVLVIGTMDVQREPPRVEILWAAYGAEQEMWLLDWETVPGDLDMPDMQKILGAHVFSKRFQHPYSGVITPYCYGMDYGWQTKVKAVMTFCKAHKMQKMFAVKGFPHESLSAIAKYEFDRRERCRKFYFNTDALKADAFDRLRISEPGARYVHIPKALVTLVGEDGVKTVRKTKFTDLFYEELCSERRITKRNPDGTITYRWKKVSDSARNEPLDLLVYSIGLFGAHNLDAAVGQEWKKVQKLMQEAEAEKAKASHGLAALVPPVKESAPQPAQTPPMPANVERELTAEEMKPREIPLNEPPRNPGGAPLRKGPRRQIRRPMQNRRPPWMSGQFYNPLSI
jgi:phage terminase large subunit GpA-like protein